MAVAHFRFYEELNDFLPSERRKVDFDYMFERRAAIKDVIEALGVPHTEVELILVNGRSAGFDYILADGDRVSVYPVFESMDIAPLIRLRPAPLRTPRFVLDAHLGTLARYLRLLGFDTLYRNDYNDDELAQISAAEHRILLTRDRDLLKRKIITHGMFVRSDKPRAQLADICRRLNLYGSFKPFSRCTRCNGLLEPIDKSAVIDQLEPKTKLYYDRFLRCTNCGQVYWKGSHFERMTQLIAQITGRADPEGDRS